MPMSKALKYSGIQRDYALCIRQIQIQLYRRPEAERLHFATYREVERSSHLLFYLRDNKIHSADDFRKAVSDAEARLKNLKSEKDSLTKKIADEEKLIGDIPKYLEILNRRPLMPNDIKELSKFTHLQDVGVISLDDAEKLKEKIEEMKKSLVSLEEQLKTALSEKKTASDFYAAYENQMKSDYQILLEQAKAEMESLRREEERQKAELERSEVQEERKPQSRKKTGFSL